LQIVIFKKKRMKTFLRLIPVAILLFSFLYSCKQATDETEAELLDTNVKNVILLIGDGMGVSQIYAGLTVNKGHLALEKCKHIGFIKTNSFNSYITDSGAGGTAFACGKKTRNGMIGMGPDSTSLKTILEMAEENGYSTGLVSTSSITHATPASFIAHEVSRSSYEEIAADFLDTEIDLFIGGGEEHFNNREDGMDLVKKLEEKGYSVIRSLDEAENFTGDKLAGFTAPGHNPQSLEGRGNMLDRSVAIATEILSRNESGFFLMAEGSMIDWGAHANNTDYIVAEMLDFDRAVAQAIDFADKNENTLVVVTADHETGGMTINGGDFETGQVEALYTTKGHTGVMVPVFAYGKGAENFIGIYDNTDIFYKLTQLFGFSLEDQED
jgi:alkaline phosphatase